MKLKPLVHLHCKQSFLHFVNLHYYIEKMVERDYFMTAEEAMNFGLIDKVLEKRVVEPRTEEPKK